jgi:Ala-tRNA(Pro) deacylase
MLGLSGLSRCRDGLLLPGNCFRAGLPSLLAEAAASGEFKAVVLSDGGRYTLAVLPASHHLQLSDLRIKLGHEVHLASEPEAADVFRDCALGASPAVGACYGLDVIIDNSIDQQHELYFEGGDHATLVHGSGAEFARLNPQAQHGSFSARD